MVTMADARASELLTRMEVAKLLHVSLRTVDALPLRRIRISQRLIRYDADEVQRYLKKQKE